MAWYNETRKERKIRKLIATLLKLGVEPEEADRLMKFELEAYWLAERAAMRNQ